MTRSALPDDSDAIALLRAAGQPVDDELPTGRVVLVLAAAAVIGSVAGWVVAGIMVGKKRSEVSTHDGR